ncbi:MAG TPA: succinate dehydrogenase/fumarate reductase iron-sulfur subunit [Oceanipulchritudo sp.]|nr:succinate dehydrogenase/fumarate reductase iron-sulfur subunit [Oceanipulchritudo sp.]
MSEKTISITLKVWRQKNAQSAGQFDTYQMKDVSTSSSFLEMLDLLNEQLIAEDREPIAFDHDCREGICGTCSLVINGIPHGKNSLQTTCQLHMRSFEDGETITIEPYRSKPFPVVRDLVVDRGAFDTIMQAGGFIEQRIGAAQDANALPISKTVADKAMDAAACIGCGACVAVCPNASAMLFTSAKLSQLNMLPQGRPEKDRRSLKMVRTMDEAGFGNCTNIGECEAACPKGISLDFIAMMNRDYAVASVKEFVGALR